MTSIIKFSKRRNKKKNKKKNGKIRTITSALDTFVDNNNLTNSNNTPDVTDVETKTIEHMVAKHKHELALKLQNTSKDADLERTLAEYNAIGSETNLKNNSINVNTK